MKLRNVDDFKLMAAAIEVRDMIKNGEINPDKFDMGTFGDGKLEYVCNTSHCLGGWMSVVLKQKYVGNPTSNMDCSLPVFNAAKKLFHPPQERFYSSDIKTGLKALNNFIKGSSNPWKGVA